MKQIRNKIFRLLLIISFSVIAAGMNHVMVHASDDSYTFSLESNSGDHVDTGDRVSIALSISKDDGSSDFKMYALSLRVRYNSDLFELVDATKYSGVDYYVTELSGFSKGWSDIVFNCWGRSLDGVTWQNPTEMAVLVFKSLQDGEGSFKILNNSVSTKSGMNTFPSSVRNIIVTVGDIPAVEDPEDSSENTGEDTSGQGQDDTGNDAKAVPEPVQQDQTVQPSDESGDDEADTADQTAPASDSKQGGAEPAQTADASDNETSGAPSQDSAGITGFTDVTDPSSPIYKPIFWAAGEGIIKGYGDGTFGPEDSCTREQFVVMIWRLSGRPEASAEVSFNDVSRGKSTFKAIQWAVAQGIIRGFDDGTFRPTATVTREQIVIMLWRMTDRESADDEISFTDMDDSASSYRAVQWGSSKGIVKGYLDGSFGPKRECLRQEIAIFLYRYARIY